MGNPPDTQEFRGRGELDHHHSQLDTPRQSHDERRERRAASRRPQIGAASSEVSKGSSAIIIDHVRDNAIATYSDCFQRETTPGFVKGQALQSVATDPHDPQDYPNPMPAIHQHQISHLDPTGARTRMFSKKHLDSAKPGDVLMVTTKSGEPFSGVFMQIRRQGVDTAIQLRGQLMKVSVEMWFKIYAPTTTAIDIIWRRPKRARRARLTYLRKAKHDMGNVDNLVFAWRKERYALRSKANPKGPQGKK